MSGWRPSSGMNLALGLASVAGIVGLAAGEVGRRGSRSGVSDPTWFHGTTRYWWKKRAKESSTLHVANAVEEAQQFAMHAAENEGATVEGDVYSEIVVIGFTDDDLAPLERGVDWGLMNRFEVDLNAGTSPKEMQRLYKTDKKDPDTLTWEDSVRGCGYMTVFGDIEALKKRGRIVSRFDPSTQAWTSVSVGKRGSRSVQAHLVEGMSPLDYSVHHGEPVRRLSLHLPGLSPPDPREYPFARTERTVRTSPATGRPYKVPRIIVTPGCDADPVHGECLGFLDYHVIPGTGGAVYLDFYSVRKDQRGHGYGTRLVDELYLRFADAPWIDWGRVVSDRAEKTMRRIQEDPGMPRTHGKIW